MVSNARSLSKLASSLSMNDGSWVNHDTWDVIHSNPKTMQEQWMLDMVTSFTPAGIHAYDLKRAELFRKANG